MTLRYVLGIGPPDRIAELERAPRAAYGLVPRTLGSSGIALITEAAAYYPLKGGGCIFGTLFHRYGAPVPIETLDEDDGAAVARSSGAHLLERFWGAYVAFFPGPGGGLVLRDPTGMMPCIYTVRDGLTLFASDADLLAATRLYRPALSLDGLTRSLYLPAFPTEQTALEGVSDLLPGMALALSRSGRNAAPQWNPWDHAAFVKDQGTEAHAEQLHRVAQSCLTAWSNVHDRALVSLSGGLDSSVVAAGLSKAGNKLSCLTLVTKDAMGDERLFGRVVANHLEAPLHEAYYALNDIDLDRSVAARRPRPCGRTEALAYDAALLASAKRSGANAVFSGNGGDNVFYMSYSAMPVADRFLYEGFSAGFWQTLRDVSELTGATLVQVARQAFRAWHMSRAPYVWQAETSFLATDIVGAQAKRTPTHPWLELPSGGLPGKAAHIAMLMRVQHSAETYDWRGDLPVVHPLLSQPIVELCLAIPTWRQSSGGRDRAVARSAFKSLLPTMVIDRRGKGGPDGFAFEILRHFRTGIRERLLDGYLANAGLVDRTALEAALSSEAAVSSRDLVRLLSFTDTEAWIAHWLNKRARS